MSAERLSLVNDVVALSANTYTSIYKRMLPQVGLRAYFAGQGTFSVNIKITHDDGTTWTTAKVVDSAATTTAKGGTSGYLNIAEIDVINPGKLEIGLIDTSGSSNNVRYDITELDY